MEWICLDCNERFYYWPPETVKCPECGSSDVLDAVIADENERINKKDL